MIGCHSLQNKAKRKFGANDKILNKYIQLWSGRKECPEVRSNNQSCAPFTHTHVSLLLLFSLVHDVVSPQLLLLRELNRAIQLREAASLEMLRALRAATPAWQPLAVRHPPLLAREPL